jgi:GT2 family glycosyltransferase
MSDEVSAASRPEASVIVVTHNNDSLIADCLASVRAGIRAHSYEIIVVDNASTDGTLGAIPDDASCLQTIALETNVGFAKANNAGIDASRGRLIVLVNSDAFPDPGSIDVLIDAVNGLPRAGIVGGRLRYPSGEPQPSVGRFPSLLGGLWVALFLHRAPLTARVDVGVSAHPALYRTRREVDWVTAAFCVARPAAGRLPVGSFMYGEDVEWALACRQAGLEVWLEPAATAIHVGRASVDESRDAGFAQRQRAQFELEWFARRGPLAQLAARGVLVVHAFLRLVAYGVLSTLRRRWDHRVQEYLALLRAATSKHPARASEGKPRDTGIDPLRCKDESSESKG